SWPSHSGPRSLQPLRLRLAQGDQPLSRAQLPGVVVAPARVAPAGEGAQHGLAPGGRAVVLDGGEAAGEDAGEVAYAPADPGRQPGGVLVADPAHPARLGPLLGGGGKRRAGWTV